VRLSGRSTVSLKPAKDSSSPSVNIGLVVIYKDAAVWVSLTAVVVL